MKVMICSKDIIKKYGISYGRLNYLTKKGLLNVAGRDGNKRLYSLIEVDRRLNKKEKLWF